MTDARYLSRRALLTGAGGAVAATSVGSPLLWVPPAAAAAPPSGVHLAYGSRPARQMALSWSTPRSVRRPRLELGVDGSYGTVLRPETRSVLGVDSVYHHVEATGLRPGTRYRYRITHHGAGSVEGSFTTAPARPEPFRFVAFGDMGVGEAAAQHLRLIRRHRPDLAFVVGDLCYADSSGGTVLGLAPELTQDLSVWDAWFEQIAPSASRIPWMTTVGNHEMEVGQGELGYDGYLARTNLPRNGTKASPTYSFRRANVAFVALDGNDASYEITRNTGYTGAAQDLWLEDRLARYRADPGVDFIVVGFHHCMYCSNLVHGSDAGMRTRWEPLFDRFSVDLVVNGHNHCYERTHLVRGAEPTLEAPRGASVDSRRGTTYLTVGGAGQAEYPAGGLPASYVTEEGGVRVPETVTWSAVAYQGHSVAFVDVTPSTRHSSASMTIRAVAKDGTVIDRVRLTRPRQA